MTRIERRLPVSLVAGAGVTAFFMLTAAIACAWTPIDPAAFAVAERLQGPSPAHWFGTDHFGRDVFSNVMAGSITSMTVALIAAGVGMAFGVPLGLLAAAAGGWREEWLMRASDILFAFPALILAILLTAVLGPGAVNAVIAIGVFNVPVFARLTRGSALSLWKREFVAAARASGKGSARISLEHIVPNIGDLLIVQGTIQFSLGILAEAGLSYVGLGAAAPTPSWGRMLAESQTIASIAPWTALFPGVAIVLCVLGLNLLGDGLRDALDPKLRGGR